MTPDPAAGRSEEAIGLDQRALDDQRHTPGPDHQDTLATRFSIAQQLAARGDDAGAEKEFRYMLPHLRRKLGPDHPNTLAAIEWTDYIQRKRTIGPLRRDPR